MLKDIINRETLEAVASELKKKRFKPGYDGMSMDGAFSWIKINGSRFCNDVLRGDYTPMPAVGFRTAKINGGFRELVRVSALDSVLQNALLRAISPIAEEMFHDCSMAYRPGRGIHSALEKYVAFANKSGFAAKIDLTSCFSCIDHAKMQEFLIAFFGDDELVRLIMTFVRTSLFIDGEIIQPQKGILQGAPISPLLCNIYLHALDCFLADNEILFIRYADDIVLFSETLASINSFCDKTTCFLENELLLSCNKKKLKIDSPTKIQYLGHKFSRDKKGVIAYDVASDKKNAFYNWHSLHPQNNRERVDLISDGILRQKAFSLFFDTENVDIDIPVSGTGVINVYSDVVFDSGALSMAMKNGIVINIFDKKDNCVGSFFPQTPLKAPKITHEQLLEYYDEVKRAYLTKEFLLASIHNTLLNIRYYEKHEPCSEYENALKQLKILKTKIKNGTKYEELLLLEAQARNAYYACFDKFLKNDGFVFEKRTRRPPKNKLNALLSYGNTVLYSLISTEIQKTALDVRIGFLHATGTRSASLNLDIAEIFKPLLVDRTIFSLVNKGVLKESHFILCENDGVYLSDEGKKQFLHAFYAKLDSVITVKDRQMSYNSIIVEEIRKLIRHFKNIEKYKAFRQVR